MCVRVCGDQSDEVTESQMTTSKTRDNSRYPARQEVSNYHAMRCTKHQLAQPERRSSVVIRKACTLEFGITGRESENETEADKCICQRRQATLSSPRSRRESRVRRIQACRQPQVQKQALSVVSEWFVSVEE